jgi:hypothetical protein
MYDWYFGYHKGIVMFISVIICDMPFLEQYCHVFIARGNNKRGFSGFNEGVYLNSYRDYTQQM